MTEVQNDIAQVQKKTGACMEKLEHLDEIKTKLQVCTPAIFLINFSYALTTVHFVFIIGYRLQKNNSKNQTDGVDLRPNSKIIWSKMTSLKLARKSKFCKNL